MRRPKYAGDLVLYDQETHDHEVKQPGENVGYRADSSTTWTHAPDEKKGVPAGHALPNLHHDEANAGTSRVTQHGVTDFVQGDRTYNKYAVLIPDLLAQVGPDVLAKANGLKFSISRVLPGKGFWSFSVPGSKGETYSVRLKVLREGNAKDVERHHVQVSCSCPFFQWQGPEHWAKVNGYLYGKPTGTASKPDVKDPGGKHWACKHVVAVLNRARNYRFANGLGLSLTHATVGPAPSAVSVARRHADIVSIQACRIGQKDAVLGMKNLTASDRSSLIRLSSSFEPGSAERRAILAGLARASSGNMADKNHTDGRALVAGDASFAKK